jgi:hypothetical protein
MTATTGPTAASKVEIGSPTLTSAYPKRDVGAARG